MSIATKRAERQQMRQRGAANRKVKDVDFGFSFDTPQLPSTQPARVSPRITPTFQRVEIPLPRALTPSNKLSRPSTPLSRRSSTRQKSDTPNRRAPGSSRNSIPSLPSVYDFPPDVEPEQRSPKRRRIAPFETIDEEGPSNSNSPYGKFRRTETITQSIEEIVSGRQQEQTLHTAVSAAEQPSVDSVLPPGEPTSAISSGVAPGQSLQKVVSVGKGDGLEKGDDSQKRHAQDTPRKRKKRKSVRLLRRKRVQAHSKDSQHQEEVENAEPVEPLGDQEQLSATQEKPKKSIRRRPSPSKARATDLDGEAETRHLQGEEKENEALSGSESQDAGNARQYSEDTEENADAQVKETERERTKTKQAQRSKSAGQKKKGNGRAKRPQVEGPALAQHGDEELESAQSEQQETTQHAEPKRNRKGRKRASRATEDASDDERTTNTIPVTVHRLANISALETVPFGDSDLSDNEHTAPNKASSGHKYLSRSGINGADVLSQLCGETLDKTVSTIQANIEQEQNVGRVKEWKHKCRVVQEFGSELETALFDISELLESNFSLAARLKGEKKAVLQLRHRLMSLRNEREEVALRIDDVRRKHVDDESERMEHDSLNNSLHDLQLALDRSHKRKDSADDDLFTGLEFLLRTVAQDVSSTAPDSRGGLLNQVKQFNSQLEKTALLLEETR
ncbi:hypothetical protein PRK78_005133 [Emydomyces testavorans]|uniref:Inner kinetochore subunit AME1 domain-containing protein n=1 Tax=Emydomyces testavorans TaxID=2070801 RepID=A0AAF0IMC4_9EURO|nr:hypothetical protein PRK78_005133 [Emydomyces testavorans]